jgi:hypothetical protein
MTSKSIVNNQATKRKIYVGCSLAVAPKEFKDSIIALKKLLRHKYEVLEFKGQIAGSNEDVYRWDIEHCVANCDVFVAVCDYPSLGLGWELNEAIRLDKRVLGVAHTDSVVSRLVLGAAEVKPNFMFERYEDLLENVPLLLDKNFI